MRQRLFVSAVFVLLTGACYAQWTKEDSLRLKKSLKEGEELKLNKEDIWKTIIYKNHWDLSWNLPLVLQLEISVKN